MTHLPNSSSPNSSPKIVRIDLLDTEYAQILAGEAIPADRQGRLEAADAETFRYLGQQMSLYRYGKLDQEGKDDVLCKIGLKIGLLTPGDQEEFNDRIRNTGHFYLLPGERLQIINWLTDEFGIKLDSPPCLDH
jgi:hypothetical protein